MNLITCNENCQWQEEGCCRLEEDAQIGVEKVNGCCYYKPIETHKKSTNLNGVQVSAMDDII